MGNTRNCLIKADLADAIYAALPVDKEKALQIVEDYIELIKEALEKESKVLFSGFGSYEVRHKPAQGQESTDRGTDHPAARKVVKFKPSPLLRKAVDGQQVTAEDEDGNDSDVDTPASAS